MAGQVGSLRDGDLVRVVSRRSRSFLGFGIVMRMFMDDSVGTPPCGWYVVFMPGGDRLFRRDELVWQK